MLCRFKKEFLQLFFVAISIPVAAQITGNLNVKDPKALEITPSVSEKLCGKTWWSLKIKEIKRGEKEERDNREIIKFSCNGEIDGKNGKWEAINQQYIKIKRPEERKYHNFILNGAYSIYEISDTTLVLAQVLTSNGDWAKEYTFTTSQRKYHLTHPQASIPKYSRAEKHVGETITRYDNGNIASKEYYKSVKRKLTATQLFEFSVPPDNVSLIDSTMYEIIPIGNWITFYPDGRTESVSQYDSIGRQNGDWISYFQNGNLKNVSHYDNSGKSIKNSVSYDESGKLKWISHYSPPIYSDVYQYNADGTLSHVVRQLKGRTLYVLGKGDSIGISKIEIFMKGRTGSHPAEILQLFNFGAKETIVKLKANQKLGVSIKDVRIKPTDSVLLDSHLVIPQGSGEYFLSLSTDEWTYKIKIHSFGFDLTTSDFESNKTFVLPSTFYFYLEPEGYQLEMIPLSNATRKKTIPISQQLTEIQLKKDKYQLTLHSPSGKRSITVEIK